MCLFWPADVPHSYHHYYSNPSYHTLSQNRPPLPHLPNNHDRTIKVNVSFDYLILNVMLNCSSGTNVPCIQGCAVTVCYYILFCATLKWHYSTSKACFLWISDWFIILSIMQNTNNQLFCSVKNMERERRGLFGVESNATLPADWKHHEPRKDSGPSLWLSDWG